MGCLGRAESMRPSIAVQFCHAFSLVLSLLNFAGILKPKFAKCLQMVICMVGGGMACSRLGSRMFAHVRELLRKLPFWNRSVVFRAGDIAGVSKSPGWQVDILDVGNEHALRFCI